MAEHFDAVVLGMGPGGEVTAGVLLDAGMRVAVIEQELIGGECAYWACIPSKTLLRPLEARTGTERAEGVSGARLNWDEARSYRDYMIRNLDDAAQAEGYREQGAQVFKGRGRIAGPGIVEVDDRQLTAEHIIVATGAEAMVPELPGIDSITFWTNRETYTASELPQRAIVVGGSAVGLETSLFLAGFGVDVILLHRGRRLLEREEPRVGELAEAHLRNAGVDVRLSAEAREARREGTSSVLELKNGDSVSADVVVFATGRRPRTAQLDAHTAGVVLGDRGEVRVDEHCRAADGVWAVGDVTGIMPFTHVAKYQGRIAADAILGRPRPATYEGIPRVVFTDPEIAAAGLTVSAAEGKGLRVESVEIDLGESLARPWTYEKEPRGRLGLLADVENSVLVGAWAVAPLAGEWIHQASLAIRARIPLAVLRDQPAQFPTYTEGYFSALEKLATGSGK